MCFRQCRYILKCMQGAESLEECVVCSGELLLCVLQAFMPLNQVHPGDRGRRAQLNCVSQNCFSSVQVVNLPIFK